MRILDKYLTATSRVYVCECVCSLVFFQCCCDVNVCCYCEICKNGADACVRRKRWRRREGACFSILLHEPEYLLQLKITNLEQCLVRL